MRQNNKGRGSGPSSGIQGSHAADRSVKHSGQVFTPGFLVRNMLDYAGYVCGNILEKHIIDNSCGAGAFLCEAVARYCNEYVANHDDNVGLKADLERFVHGIELDPVVCADCRSNLDGIAKDFGVENVGWDLLNTNALSVTRYDGQMDFVVGNPPYVRVHNLEEGYDEVKSFRFAEGGMTDLYLAFYELGLRMINGTGKLCYITPSSWLSSVAATNMRKYVMQHRTLAGLIDLGHQQVFENVTAYTMIALFDARHQADGVEYYTYSAADSDKVYVDTITYGEMSIGDSFYVASKEDLSLLRVVKTASVPRYVRVKNGFATLADKVFISNVSFDALTIPVLKASTGKWYKAFFPYDAAGKPLSREAVFSHPDVADYLNRNKKELLKKHTERENPDWYLYGRTQAIRDVFERKYSINSIIKDVSSIRLIDVPACSGLYSGLYILSRVPYDVLKSAVESKDFIDYLAMLKNYKSGGYYTYGSKDLEQYLNYKIACHERATDFIPVDER